MGLSASFHFTDFPKWRPYSKLFNEPLRVSFGFLLLVCLSELAFDAALKHKACHFREKLWELACAEISKLTLRL
jgi:hypothetical protein